ncbi:PHD finger protein 10 [Entophlyctis luteolus]|nr:PHD finger protein 10 [Entophlyctis luteolus]
MTISTPTKRPIPDPSLDSNTPREGSPSKQLRLEVPTSPKKDNEIPGPDDPVESDEETTITYDKVGETKITRDGELRGDRKFKCRYFRLARHPTRYYMLTLDVARSLGFRDSYLLHIKNVGMKRLFATDEDKQVLESMDMLSSNFKTRALGIMPTRSVFKMFGHQVVVRGKPVRDDYTCDGKVEPEDWVDPAAADDGHASGSDHEDDKKAFTVKRPTESISYYEQLYRAPANLVHGYGTAVVPTADGTVPTNLPDPRSEANLMRAAASAADFNSRLRAQRRRDRMYDVHTGVEQVAQRTQPTHVLIEKQVGGEGFDKNQETGMVLEVSFGEIKAVPPSSESRDWIAISTPEDEKQYPLAVLPGQYQSAFSVHRTRFEQNVSSIKSNEAFFVDFTGQPLVSSDGQFVAVQPGSRASGRPPASRPIVPGQNPGRPMGTPVPGMRGGEDENFNSPGFVPQGMTSEQWAVMKPKLTYSQLKELKEQAPVVSMGPSGKYTVRFTCGYLTRSGNYCQKPVLEAGIICLFHQRMRAQEQQEQLQQQQQAAMMAVNGGMGMMMGAPPVPTDMSFQMQNSPIRLGAQSLTATPQRSSSSALAAKLARGKTAASSGSNNSSASATPNIEHAVGAKSATAAAGATLATSATEGKSGGGATGSRKSAKSSKAKNLEDPECAICHSEDPPPQESDQNPPRVLLRCDTCGLGHHLLCADISTPVMVSKVLNSGKWKCGNCKMCDFCGKAGDDETLMVLCDACDKGFHTYCLEPKLDHVPSGVWHCPSCRICVSCGTSDNVLDARHVSVPPTQEDMGITGNIEIYVCTYCGPCHKRFTAEQFCPLCFHVYKDDVDEANPMACCDICDRWIHVGCDPDLTEVRYKKLDTMNAKYTCVLCAGEGNKMQQFMARMDKANRSVKPSRLMMYHGKYLVVPPLVKRPPEKV